MNVAVTGIGLATAQGSTAEILESKTPYQARELPWTPNRWNVSRSCYPALGIDPTLSGVERWQTLAKKALADLGGQSVSRNTPLLAASCNGSAAGFQTENWEQAFDTSALLKGTPWADERLPVFSSSCASGIHALYAAKQLLDAGAVDEVFVLAVDIISQSNHDNFEGLRVLAEKPGPPWQSSSTGFILGEAAVVVSLARTETEFPVKAQRRKGDKPVVISGPVLQSDLEDHDGLSGVLESVSAQDASLILGQGTGPFENDAAELAAFSSVIDKHVPVTTPLSHFGHTLGASGLLAVALGALSQTTVVPYLITDGQAMDGRPMLSNAVPPRYVLTTCRALNGACAATLTGFSRNTDRRHNDSWKKTTTSGPLMNPTLKRLAAEALAHRPSAPPDVLILRLEKPLSPPASAFIGERLLPSVVLEITPGFASLLIARCWGFTGPALCLVGDVDADVYGLKNAFRESGLNVFQVNLRGSGDNRAIEWNA
jgi:hypothetical protein